MYKYSNLVTICIVQASNNEIKEVHQFHFTAWPDYGVPKHATDFIEFQKRIVNQQKHQADKPMLVHCR